MSSHFFLSSNKQHRFCCLIEDEVETDIIDRLVWTITYNMNIFFCLESLTTTGDSMF